MAAVDIGEDYAIDLLGVVVRYQADVDVDQVEAGRGVEFGHRGDHGIADLALGSPTRPRIVHPGLLGYVLPGQVMRWPIERTAIDRDNDQITAKLNGESEQTPLSPPSAR